MKIEKRNLASYILSLSLLILAGAIVYFAYQISLVNVRIPEIIKTIDSTVEKMRPMVKELEKIRVQIPVIIDEVKEVRKLVPPILEEAASARMAIPPIMEESERIRASLPEVLQSLDQSSQALTYATKELQAYRPLVPELLKQVEKTRDSIDPTLDRLDQMIVKVEHSGELAGKGAGQGLIKGILTSPFRIIGGIGTTLFDLTGAEKKSFSMEESEELRRLGSELLAVGQVGSRKIWQSKTSNARGEFTIDRIYIQDDRICKSLLVNAWKNETLAVDRTFNLCQKMQGFWEIMPTDAAEVK